MMVGQGAESEVDRKKLFASARRFVEALAADGPIAIVFEDLHWGDRSLLELIQWLVNRLGHSRVMFLTLARPELFEAEPGWGGGITGYTSVPLGPLPGPEARDLAHRLRTDLDEAALERIEQSSGGNPLFVEELTAWVSDASPGDEASFPTSVRSIVAARLDTLPGRLRQVLLDASVVGLTFWRKSLEVMSGDDIGEALDELVARDLVRREAVSRLPGDEQYVFRHQLIHDVAYEILPKTTRRERHRATAQNIEERVANTETVAGILARHWQEAGDTERAIHYLLEAAEVAGRGWEQTEAFDLLKQALALVPPEDTARKRQVTLKLAVARQIWAHSVLDAETIREYADGSDQPHDH
jgi:predicted ATPase